MADAAPVDALAVTAPAADALGAGDAAARSDAGDAAVGDAARPVDVAVPSKGDGPVLACPAEAPSTPTTFFEAPYIAIGNLALDDRHVYLKVSDCCVDPPGYTVRVPLGGGAGEVIHGSIRYHTGLALDDARVSFAAEEGLKTFDKTTGEIAVIPGVVYSSVARFGGQVFAAAAGRLAGYASDGTMVRSAEGSFDADGLLVDGAGIAFTNRGGAGHLLILRAGATAPVALVPGTGTGGDLVADADYYYWQDANGVYRVSRAGGGAILVAGNGMSPAGLALAGGTLYFTTLGRACTRATGGAGTTGGSLYRVPVTGGSPVELARDLVGPGKVAVNATHVYWVAGTNQNHYQAVHRLAR
jgi:hypothetical protein